MSRLRLCLRPWSSRKPGSAGILACKGRRREVIWFTLKQMKRGLHLDCGGVCSLPPLLANAGGALNVSMDCGGVCSLPPFLASADAALAACAASVLWANGPEATFRTTTEKQHV